jgi:hypothetical protein
MMDAPVIVTGVMAGAAGTLALSLSEAFETKLLGHKPVYAAAVIGVRLFLRGRSRFPKTTAAARRLGLVVRWLYGITLGMVYALLAMPASSALIDGLLVGTAIYVYEIFAMPAIGATPKLARWRPAEPALLFWHTTVFGVTTAAVASIFDAAY